MITILINNNHNNNYLFFLKATLPSLFDMDIHRRALIIYTSGTTGKNEITIYVFI